MSNKPISYEGGQAIQNENHSIPRSVLVTGANGFVGRALVRRLVEDGYDVRIATRQAGAASPEVGQRTISVGRIDSGTDWRTALDGIDIVVHLAGILPGSGSAADMHEINALGTQNLARQCLDSSVRTFLYASSIGAITGSEAAVTIDDFSRPAPTTPYGRSKLAAEDALKMLIENGRSAVALRPPLVYGAQAQGSFSQLLRIADSSLPLPFGWIDNLRSMVSVDNLASAFACAVRASNLDKSGNYAVCDPTPVGLRDLTTWLRQGLGRPVRLVGVPAAAMRTPLNVLGRKQLAGSLFGNLVLDGSRFREAFQWSPPESAPDAIRRSGREYAATRR